jgi:16S rRNA (guanine(527)-N(7))-methyltransferase RsmG
MEKRDDGALSDSLAWLSGIKCALEVETSERIRASGALYAGILEEWNRSINLVSEPTLRTFFSTHWWDSLRAIPLLKSAQWIDFGSGGGLPSIPLLLSLRGARATLVEKVEKKRSFLKVAGAELGLSGRVSVVSGLGDCRFEGKSTVLFRAVAPSDFAREVKRREDSFAKVRELRVLYWGPEENLPDKISSLGRSEAIASDGISSILYLKD